MKSDELDEVKYIPSIGLAGGICVGWILSYFTRHKASVRSIVAQKWLRSVAGRVRRTRGTLVLELGYEEAIGKSWGRPYSAVYPEKVNLTP
jgi:hypothetical protein